MEIGAFAHHESLVQTSCWLGCSLSTCKSLRLSGLHNSIYQLPIQQFWELNTRSTSSETQLDETRLREALEVASSFTRCWRADTP